MSNLNDKLALVLSGRDIHGIGGLALLEYIEEKNIPVGSVIGTSGGALVGALWTQGFSLADIESICIEVANTLYSLPQDKINALLFFWAPSNYFNISRAILNPKVLKSLLKDIFGNRTLESSNIKTSIMVTNALDATPFAITYGKLADILYAALATPPLLPPGLINSSLYVDGIFSAALPVMNAINTHAGKILVFNCMSAEVSLDLDFRRQYMHFTSRSAYHAQKGKLALAIDLHNDEIFFLNITASGDVTKVETMATELLMKGRLNIMRNKENLQHLLGQ